MASFCTKCGSPLADGQGFCTKCGLAAGATAPAPPRSVGLSPLPTPPNAAAQRQSNRTLIKVLLICGGVVVLFVIAGIASVGYFFYRHKDEIHQMGLDDPASMQYRGPVLGGADPCGLLSKEDVSEVVKMPVVRAENTIGGEVGCEYSVIGDRDDLVASHIAAISKGPATASQRRDMDTMARSFFHSNNHQPSFTAPALRHPGEAPVFVFILDNNAAKMQMGLTRTILNRMAPGTSTNLTGVGDDAFDLGAALIMARQGDTIVRAMYTTCPCVTTDAQALVQKIVSNMSEK
jgi:hypothetical protein